MKVFVTGGTGFAGSHLVSRLVQEKHKVYVLARSSSNKEVLEKLNVEIITGDVTDRELLFYSMRNMDIVFHLAAAFRKVNLSDKRYWEVNFDGTKNILDSCLENKVKKLIHCSTTGVVTTVANPPGDETSKVCGADVYQKSKCAAELEVIKYAKEKGLSTVVIRPCAIYGPGDFRMLKLFKMIANKRFLFFGNGQAFLHLVYIENLIDGFLLAAQKEEAIGEIFIIGDEKYITLNDLAELIAEEFKVPAPKLHLPYLPFEFLARLVEFTYKILKIQKEPPIYRRRIAFFKNSRAFSIQKARKILDYNPGIDLKTGIHLTAQWYLENGFIGKQVN